MELVQSTLHITDKTLFFKFLSHSFDSFVIVTSIILLCIEAAAAPYYPILRYLVIFRPLKLIR